MILRRRQLLSTLGVGLAALPASRLFAGPFRMVPQRPSARVIVDNDFSGDPDGLVALAHQLLSPKTRIPLVTASALNTRFVEPALVGRSASTAADIAQDLIRRAGIGSAPPVIAGSETFDLGPSAAAQAIVAEALRDDPLPLYLTCGGPLTNVAAALRLAPEIASRMTVIWIGGGNYPEGGWEYNLATDAPAARAVIEDSRVPLWQVPQGAYRQMQYSVAELAAEMRPISPFAAWLYDSFTHPPDFVDLGGTWPLGDSPLVLLTALTGESSHYTERPARRLLDDDGRYGEEIAGRIVRVYDQLDARLTFADFIAKLRLHGQ